MLKPKGKVAVMHWMHNVSTPRGPDMSIRPRSEQIVAWLTQSGFEVTNAFVPLPPYHFGTVGTR